jgi:hypothetical protein
MTKSKLLITGGCSFSAPRQLRDKKTWVEYFQEKYDYKFYYHSGLGAAGNDLITQRLLWSLDNAIQKNYKDITMVVMWSENIRKDIFTNDWSLDMDTDNGNIIFTDNIWSNLLDDEKSTHKITSGFIRTGGEPYDEEFYRNEKQRKWILEHHKFYNEEASLMNTIKNILLIQNICKEQGVKCIMFIMKDIFKNVEKYPQLKYLYDLVDWDMFLFYEGKYGLYEYTAVNDLEFWEDNFHPAYSAHKSFIDHFDKDIKKLC